MGTRADEFNKTKRAVRLLIRVTYISTYLPAGGPQAPRVA